LQGAKDLAKRKSVLEASRNLGEKGRRKKKNRKKIGHNNRTRKALDPRLKKAQARRVDLRKKGGPSVQSQKTLKGKTSPSRH